MELDGGRARHSIEPKGQFIRTIHPYDLAEYHWAHSPNGADWTAYLSNGRFGQDAKVEARGHVTGVLDPEEVVRWLRDLDRAANIRACIDHS